MEDDYDLEFYKDDVEEQRPTKRARTGELPEDDDSVSFYDAAPNDKNDTSGYFREDEVKDEQLSKSVRFADPPQSPSPPPSDACYDDTEDFYRTPEKPNIDSSSSTLDNLTSQTVPQKSLIPGLGMLTSATATATATDTSKNSDPSHNTESLPSDQMTHNDETSSQTSSQEMYGSRPKHINSKPSAHVGTGGNVGQEGNGSDFREAAALNKTDEQAEWQFDTSDEEVASRDEATSAPVAASSAEEHGGADATHTNSDSTSSDSDSSDSSYEFLSLEEHTRILMRGDPEDGDEMSQRGGPRTFNEISDAPIQKPDVVVTAEMNTPELGVARAIIDNVLLIQATLSDHTKVLESGSVLCLEDKSVIGAIHDTLGRVEEPLYAVLFSSPEDIEQHNIKQGIKIFYVEDHSSFVFTQPLKQMKGSDASNLHDEEVADGEREFSDDEAEAEFRRQRKLKKKGPSSKHSETSSRSYQPSEAASSSRMSIAPSASAGTNRPLESIAGGSSQPGGYPTSLPYDEGDMDMEEDDDLYKPLARPDEILNRNPNIRYSKVRTRKPSRRDIARGNESGNPRFQSNTQSARDVQHPNTKSYDGLRANQSVSSHHDRQSPQQRQQFHQARASTHNERGSNPPARATPPSYPVPSYQNLPQRPPQFLPPLTTQGYQATTWNPQYHAYYGGQGSPGSAYPHHNPPWLPPHTMGSPGQHPNNMAPQEQARNASSASPGAFPHGTHLNPAFFAAAQWSPPVQQTTANNQGHGSFPYASSSYGNQMQSPPRDNSDNEYDPTRPWM